jgi:hypothetical protein
LTLFNLLGGWVGGFKKGGGRGGGESMLARLAS